MAPFIGFVVFCYTPPYHMPPHPPIILCSVVASTSLGHNTVRKLASCCVDEIFWLDSSLLSPDILYQGQLLVRFSLFWAMQGQISSNEELIPWLVMRTDLQEDNQPFIVWERGFWELAWRLSVCTGFPWGHLVLLRSVYISTNYISITPVFELSVHCTCSTSFKKNCTYQVN